MPFSSIDVTLLQGLEPVMSEEEQARITAMMVSGDKNELAKAAKIFYGLGILLEHGIFPHQRSEEHKIEIEASFRMQILSRRLRPPALNDRELRVAKGMIENDVERHARARSLPLPVRMPRCIQIEPYDPDLTDIATVSPEQPFFLKILNVFGRDCTTNVGPSVSFIDYPWDGKLKAAFTKLHVSKNKIGPLQNPQEDDKTWKVEEEFKPSPGFDEIVRGMPDGYDACLIGGNKSEHRTLVAKPRNDAAKLGLRRGDVVTHVNGEEFTGTVDDLNRLIKKHYLAHTGGQRLELVVNAEACVAQALKLRSWYGVWVD